MIFVSSACVKHERIRDSVEELASCGFKNIELTGGTAYYEGYEEDLLELRAKYDLGYLVHNYFPPPKNDFILNLASRSTEIYRKSTLHLEAAITLARELGTDKYGFHAGYFFDPDLNQVGRKFDPVSLFHKPEAIELFCKRTVMLKDHAHSLDLYIENNVLSHSNYEAFDQQIPFLLVDYKTYSELKHQLDFKLLLDVAHLKVSCHTLGHDFETELETMMQESDYIHLSDNDGFSDQNRGFRNDGKLMDSLGQFTYSGKILTLEIYEKMDKIVASYEAAESLFKKDTEAQAIKINSGYK